MPKQRTVKRPDAFDRQAGMVAYTRWCIAHPWHVTGTPETGNVPDDCDCVGCTESTPMNDDERHPDWADITAATDRELLARRFLDDHGLTIAVIWQASGRYRVILRRGHKSVNFTVTEPPVNGTERRPSPWDVLALLLSEKAATVRRLRRFLTQRELDDLARLVGPKKEGD